MSYSQNLKGCFLTPDVVEGIQDLLASEPLRVCHQILKEGGYPPLACAGETEDMHLYQEAAKRFAPFEDILLFGTGGSSLGAQTLCALMSPSIAPRLHFFDNIDPHTFAELFKRFGLKKTGILVVSKSGSTVETLMQMMTLLQYEGSLNPQQVMVITEPTPNPLRKLADHYGWFCLDHPPTVGGRFSCFSVVGVLPALLRGLEGEAFRKGGEEVLQAHIQSLHAPAFQGAAMNVYLAQHHQKTLSVMMPYRDRLNLFSFWYRQLWAESLGKEGKGTTPLQALGTVDQHSQLQLYLNGPKDKVFTLIGVQEEEKGPVIQSDLIPEFTGKTMGDLLQAEERATYQTLLNNQCPTRLITLNHLDEHHLGALMMHFMLETIATAALLGVNAFDQPAVEEGKRLARSYLAQDEE